jgi:hypothetical protein
MPAADTAEIEIVLAGDPPDGLHAFVYDRLGVVPEVKGPSRVDAGTVLVFVSGAFLVPLLGRLGEHAADRFFEVVVALLRRGRRTSGSAGDSNDPDDPPPADELRLVVVGDRRVVFVIERATATDPRMMAELLRSDLHAYQDGTILRWDVDLGRWTATRDDAA